MDLYSEKQIAIEPEAMEKLCTYEWPGNVRELESVMKLAITLSRGGCIRKEDIRLKPIVESRKSKVESQIEVISNYDHMVRTYEKELIVNHLVKNNWHRIKTAKELGISRNRLYKKMVALGIDV